MREAISEAFYWAESIPELIDAEQARRIAACSADEPLQADPAPTAVVDYAAWLEDIETRYPSDVQSRMQAVQALELPRLLEALEDAGTLNGAARLLGWSKAGIRKRARRWGVDFVGRAGRPQRRLVDGSTDSR